MRTARSERELLLEAEALSKSYLTGKTRLVVLRDLDLEVRRGEMLGILGISGVGKTTLLNILGLMDRPDAGSYRFDGRDVARLPERERTRFRNHRCGFVFQAHHLLPEFDAIENAAMPLWVRGEPVGAAADRARDLLERLGVGGRLHHRPGQLSGGERQRVALARAFAGSPDLVLADEPTGNLDPATAERVFELFRHVHRVEGTTTVLVTHSRELAARCDRILCLEEGRLLAGGSADSPRRSGAPEAPGRG